MVFMSCHVYIAFITFIECTFFLKFMFSCHSTLFPYLFRLMCIHLVSYKHGEVPLGQCHSSMGEGVVCTP